MNKIVRPFWTINKQKSKMAYSKDLVIILIIMLSNKLKNIRSNIIKTYGNLKPITLPALYQPNQSSQLVNVSFYYLTTFFIKKKSSL